MFFLNIFLSTGSEDLTTEPTDPTDPTNPPSSAHISRSRRLARQTFDEDDEEFHSAHASFREVEEVPIEISEEDRKLEEERDRKREEAGYVNPSYSESQEVEVTQGADGRRKTAEMNEIV